MENKLTEKKDSFRKNLELAVLILTAGALTFGLYMNYRQLQQHIKTTT